MATFATAAKDARKAGYTHLKASNGQLTPLDTIQKGTTPKGHKKNGWGFNALANVGECIIYLDRPGHLAGFYELTKG